MRENANSRPGTGADRPDVQRIRPLVAGPFGPARTGPMGGPLGRFARVQPHDDGPGATCTPGDRHGLEGEEGQSFSTRTGCFTRRVRWKGRTKVTPASTSQAANAYSDGAHVTGTSSPMATMTLVTAPNWPSVE